MATVGKRNPLRGKGIPKSCSDISPEFRKAIEAADWPVLEGPEAASEARYPNIDPLDEPDGVILSFDKTAVQPIIERLAKLVERRMIDQAIALPKSDASFSAAEQLFARFARDLCVQEAPTGFKQRFQSVDSSCFPEIFIVNNQGLFSKERLYQALHKECRHEFWMREHNKAPRGAYRKREDWPDPSASRNAEVNRHKIQSNWRLTREARARFDAMASAEGCATRQMLYDKLMAEALTARGLNPAEFGLD